MNNPQQLTNFNSSLIGSNPSQLTDISGVIYFTADDGRRGRELWKLDERGNPVPVGDINRDFGSSNPDNLIAVNGTLYFTADDGREGRELWKINETGVPEQVDDINNGANSSNPSDLTVFNNTLYFITETERYGRELFKLDSLGNPRIVKDITGLYESSNPANLRIFNDTLYFTLTDKDGRTELWRETKTGEIQQVKGISSSDSYNFSNLTIFNNSLYFSTTDDDNRTYLWKTNDLGDVEKVNGISSSYSYNPSDFIIVNDTLYFTTTDKYDNITYFWKTNNVSGKEQVERVNGINPNSYNTSNFTIVNDILYFTTTDFNGVQLWRINENGDGERVRNIQSNSSEISNFTTFNNTLYFTAADRDNRFRIYEINENGDAKQVRGTSTESEFSNFTVANGNLFYVVNNSELWQIDESIFARIVSGFNPFSSNISNLTVADNSIYFTVTDNNIDNDSKLWTVDERGYARRISDIDEMSNPQNFSVINNTLFFTASDKNYGNELWKVNDENRAIRLNPPINRETREAPSDFINVNGTLYFTAEDKNSGRKLWRIDSNGNPQPIAAPANIGDFTVVNDTLYFTYEAGNEGRQLLKITNGDSPTAKPVGNSSILWNPENLTIFDDTLYFTVTDSGGQKGLVKLDDKGNVEPVRFIDSRNYNSTFNPRNLTVVNDKLYFVFGEKNQGKLYQINERGDAEAVRDNSSSYQAINPENIYFVSNTLYFTAEDRRDGINLWTINERGYSERISIIGNSNNSPNIDNFTIFRDGLFFTVSHDESTEFWTVTDRYGKPRLEQIRNTPSFQNIDNLTVVNDTLYFTADDGRNGNELWKFDERGNVELVKDINTTNYADSNPENLTVVGDYLYFTATDKTSTKLWWVDSEGEVNEVQSINSRLTNISNITVLNDDLYLTGTDTNSRELWKISSDNARRVAEINRDSGFSEDFNLSYIDGKLYFVSDVNSSSPQIQVIENQAPELQFSPSLRTFSEGHQENYARPITITGSSSVKDVDSYNVLNGELKVRITDGGHPDDRLGIIGGGYRSIELEGNIVKHRGQEIGILTPSYGTEEMVIKFTTHFGTDKIRDLLGNISYTNFSHNPSETPRTVEFVLTDGDGGTSEVATKTINVAGRNDAPILSNEEILYDSSSNLDPTKPSSSSDNNRPVFDYQLSPNGQANKTLADSGIELTSDNEAYAGLNTTTIPPLDRKNGYTLSFNLEVLSEDHTSYGDNDKNNDGKADRAGFNVTLLGGDRQGIELGFWENRIWVKQDEFSSTGSGYIDGTNPYSTIFTQVEGVDFDTTKSVDYDLAIYGFTYTLFANNKSILSGRLRDYSKYKPTTDPERRLPNPYGKSNYIFFGDNSPYAGAEVKLGDISITTTPSSTSSYIPIEDRIIYKENEPGVIIAPNITITDYDSPDFENGKLTVSFDSITQDGDVLGINTQDNSPIQVSGNDILLNSSLIGRIENSFRGNSLEIRFTSKATPQAVETLIRNIIYASTSDGLRRGRRTIEFKLDDGDNGISNTIRKEIEVESLNDAPIVANPIKTITVNEEAEFTYTIPENTFQDIDGDTLTLNATLEDGS
ncbi:MAG: hypothetical protein SWZ49_06745, partial [Cyanobacteriota bacterium]|nr:hypothetical protein [Cyanobacteriota bacterium]